MFIERKVNPSTKEVELWQCDWEVHSGAPTKKVFLKKIADEQSLTPGADNSTAQVQAICWSYGRTLGNIAVFSPSIIGSFPEKAGNNALLPCDFVNAGKFRHGTARWWCRTHQTHWGTKADQKSYDQSGVMRCANHTQPMNYVVDPLKLGVDDAAEIGIWCSLPAAISTYQINPRPPKIHIHFRPVAGGPKSIDSDFPAVSLLYNNAMGLFVNQEISRVNVTPPAAFEFICAQEEGRDMSCVNCSHCGYPHLDLGDFARTPHKKHFCGNCGWDSTWSKGPIVSTPLKPLHDQFAKNVKFESPDRKLNLDEYSGCGYAIWASTPAILWTADRPQEYGIHVHVNDGAKRIFDDTYGEVILNGKKLERKELLQEMIKRSII